MSRVLELLPIVQSFYDVRTCSLQKMTLWKSYSAMILTGVVMLVELVIHKWLANNLVEIYVGWAINILVEISQVQD